MLLVDTYRLSGDEGLNEAGLWLAVAAPDGCFFDQVCDPFPLLDERGESLAALGSSHGGKVSQTLLL